MGVPVSLGAPARRPRFFNGLGYMGIYIGGGQMVHSPHTGDVVKISDISSGYYASSFVGAAASAKRQRSQQRIAARKIAPILRRNARCHLTANHALLICHGVVRAIEML